MRLFSASVLAGIVLAAAGSLSADPVDPGVIFVKGGHGSTDITCDTNIPFCITPLNTEINAEGIGDFVIDNDSGPTHRDIIELDFYIPTINFDQIFTAYSPLFETATIILDPGDDITIVRFSDTGSGPDSTQTGPLGSCDDSCAAGFEPFGTVQVEAIFGTPPAGDPSGLGYGQEGTLELQPNSADVPEPGTFVLLFVAVALLLSSRNLFARRAKARL